MNDTASSAPGASLLPDSTGLITSVHLIVLALFALAAVAIIVIGIVRKRRRREAEHAFEERVAEAEATPEPVPPPPPVSPAPPPPGDPLAPPGDSSGDPAAAPVTLLKGLGPKVAARLGELGITTVGDLARLSDTDAARIDADLGAFAGRLSRDRWLEQARLLASGDRAGFEERFGKL